MQLKHLQLQCKSAYSAKTLQLQSLAAPEVTCLSMAVLGRLMLPLMVTNQGRSCSFCRPKSQPAHSCRWLVSSVHCPWTLEGPVQQVPLVPAG